MKILIEVPERCAIEISAEFASVAASLMANARAVKSDGWGNDKRWSPSDDGLSMSFIDDLKIEPITGREARLMKEKDSSESERWKQYRENEENKKKVAELEKQIELLKSVTVCTATEPEVINDEEASESIF